MSVTPLRAFDRVADRIRLHRQVDKRPTIVVEGPADKRLIEEVLVAGSAAIFVAGTRDGVLAVAGDASRLGLTRIVCLVDRDFDHAVVEAEAAGQPVVAYDGGDLEDMLLDSPSARRAIGELASVQKLDNYGGVEKLLTTCRATVRPLSRLRHGSSVCGWALTFDALDVQSKVDRDDLRLRITGICSVLSQASEQAVTHEHLQQWAASEEAPVCPRTGRELARGRDVLAVVGVALRRLVGTRPKDQTKPDLLAAVIRASRDVGWLRASAWFGEVARTGGLPRPDSS